MGPLPQRPGEGQRQPPRRIPPPPHGAPNTGVPNSGAPKPGAPPQGPPPAHGAPRPAAPPPRPRPNLGPPARTEAAPATEKIAAPASASAATATSTTTASDKPEQTDEGVLASTGSIAIATLISRLTGFIRMILITATLGPAIASAFNTAYQLPNMVAEALLGAVLTAIVIPVLVRAEREDPDGGASFINRIFTLTLVVLGAGTLLMIVATPLLTGIQLGGSKVNQSLATHLTWLLLPEIIFYGLSALFIATLNMRGRFKPGAWAPVVNNLVQITTLTVFALTPGEITLNPVSMSDAKLLTLGIGIGLGVIVQALILVPFLRKEGIRLRLEWGLDARLRKFGNMAAAVILYVVIFQVGFMITTRIAAHASDAGPISYTQHWALLQLPYGVLGVTILTAIMPRLSRNAAANDTNAVVDDLSLATRLSMVALLPMAAYMTFFGPAIGVSLFAFGRFDVTAADDLGWVLTWGAFSIIPYAITLIQLRIFYAREDAWTPTYMVIGITAIRIALSYLGPVLFEGHAVVNWLAMCNGIGFTVGAIVGHFLLRRQLGDLRMTNVVRTATLTLLTAAGCAGIIWAIAQFSGLHRLATDFGKVGSLAYLGVTAVLVLVLTYTVLTLLRVDDVLAIVVSIRRLLGRFIPALAPATKPDVEATPAMTVQFARINQDEAFPYSGQVQVHRRFDRGTASWQTYRVHSGGAVDSHEDGSAPGLRYRRMGGSGVTKDPVEPSISTPTPAQAPPAANTPAPDAANTDSPAAHDAAAPPARPRTPRRGPRLVPGAAVAGGRYRLLTHHGGSRGLQFWRARDINLDRDVALTFVDAEQAAPPPDPAVPVSSRGDGPQAVLSRTLRLGRVNSPGVARVLDVVRGSSGGIVVTEWVPGSSLAEVAQTSPSPIGAARAVRALAAAAESVHRTGSALSIDHPDRIRISQDGNAVLAFPGTLAGDDKSTDVRGLGAVLYALLLAKWPLDAATGRNLTTSASSTTEVGGLAPATDDDGQPASPRSVRPEIPYEISAVAARALEGNSGIRTAATVQHVLDQATVLDQKTDLMANVPAIDDEDATPQERRQRRLMENRARQAEQKRTALRSNRAIAGMVAVGLLVLFLVVAIIIWISNALGGDDSTNLEQILTPSTSAPGPSPGPGG